ncbi:MAG: hypothetical protein HKN30_04960 [Sulfitobacter sp.]|nr:hypothetical protein [Sulfitobacter sp.]
MRDEPAFTTALDFGGVVQQGIGPGPCLLIGDQSEISLMPPKAGSGLEYRMALLARPGDHVLLRQRDREYESYLAGYLGLKEVHFHEVGSDALTPVTRRAWKTESWIETLAEVARAQGGLTLQAYLTTGNTWRLAQAIGERAGQTVHVSGPSSRVARRSNDKLWFTALAKRVIGADATPPTLAAYGPAATAGLAHRLSKQAEQVIIKVPDSAGSAGNLLLESGWVRDMSLTDLRALIRERLHAMGWQDRYPVLVGVWDSDVTASPSAQLWLPLPEDGPPVVEGIFEQRLRSEVAHFVGASRSRLMQEIQDQLSEEALRIARVLQRLGYFGRCSLDAVLCARPGGPTAIHWIECNGRWGGVSIPMAAAGQIVTPLPSDAISVVQEVLPDRRIDLADLLTLWDDLLLRPDRGNSGLIIMASPRHPTGTLINLLALDQSPIAANAVLDEAMGRLAQGVGTLPGQ